MQSLLPVEKDGSSFVGKADIPQSDQQESSEILPAPHEEPPSMDPKVHLASKDTECERLSSISQENLEFFFKKINLLQMNLFSTIQLEHPLIVIMVTKY